MKATAEHFANFWRRLPTAASPDAIFEMLRAQYQEPPRAYHTLEHVGWGLKRIDEIAQHELNDFRDLDAIEYAMWFHDAIMVFGRGGAGDEERSAELAVNVGTKAGLGVGFLRQVRRLIRATAHMADPEVPDEAVLVDADLSILGRTKVLQRFDNKRRIFTTPYASQKWEERARINIGKSMHNLTTGRWP